MEMQSTTTGELFKALSKAQGEMKDAPKDSKNPFFKSLYSGLSSCVESSREVLARHGLCVSQKTEKFDGEWVLKTILGHTSGEFLAGIFPLYPKDQSSQAFGSSLSYARRYNFQAIINQTSGILDDDANISSIPNDTPLKQASPKFRAYFPTAPTEFKHIKKNSPAFDEFRAITELQVLEIGNLVDGLGWPVEKIKSFMLEKTGKSLRSQLTQIEAAGIIRTMAAMVEVKESVPSLAFEESDRIDI